MTTPSTSTAGNRELRSADSTQSFGHGDGNGDGHGILLDAERLDCYRIAREMRSLIAPILPTLSRTLRDQLDRASLSVPLNIAEGAGRFAPGSKAQFYSIARGSANETAALLDVVLAEAGDRYEHGESLRLARGQVVRVVQMLVKLERRFGRRVR